jgi:phage shock protein E
VRRQTRLLASRVVQSFLNTLLVTVLLCACSTADPGTETSTETLIIDVRTAQEYDSGHIDGALNIPYDVIEARIAEVTTDKDREIVVYCGSGRRSGIALKTLTQMGYKQVVNEGGYEAYRKRRLKIND